MVPEPKRAAPVEMVGLDVDLRNTVLTVRMLEGSVGVFCSQGLWNHLESIPACTEAKIGLT